MSFDLDLIHKQIQHQKYFLPSVDESSTRICLGCGGEWFFKVRRADEDEVNHGNSLLQSYCDRCMSRRVANTVGRTEPTQLNWKRQGCFYCNKKRKLTGVWCRSCRTKILRRRIEDLMDRNILGGDERDNLKSYMTLNVFKRFFKKKDALKLLK